MPKHDKDKGDIGERNIGGQLGLLRINSTQRLIKKHISELKKHSFVSVCVVQRPTE
jgi:hypothetical protein